MKRFFLFFLIFIVTSTTASAQIRIEKRRYGKGWYISMGDGKQKKTNLPTAKIEKTFDRATESAEVNEMVDAITSEPVQSFPFPAEMKTDSVASVNENVVEPVKKITISTKKKTIEPIVKNVPDGKAGELIVKLENKRIQKQEKIEQAKMSRTQASDPDDFFPYYLIIIEAILTTIFSGIIICIVLWLVRLVAAIF